VQDDHPGRNIPADEPSGSMEQRETVDKVRAAIDKLPEHYRAALVLCEYEQMPYVEIAKTLNASVPQVKTWIHRARRQLAGLLKEFANR
jgi:RNA polymerase sigma-70 factor (ECF subfamily)